MSIEFVFTSLIVVLLPGTGVIYTVSAGLSRGATASIFAAVGCTMGIVPHLCASIFGIAAILHASALAFQIFKFMGVMYLAYLAWSMWRESGKVEFVKNSKANAVQIVVRGFLINILNPKLSIFFFAFLPQFVSGGSNEALTQMLFLSLVFMFMTFVVFVGYGLLANQVRHFVANSPAIIQATQKAFAGLFVALGVKLALTER
jgi:threonine/homoserine/homoserine lactone efflux protein